MAAGPRNPFRSRILRRYRGDKFNGASRIQHELRLVQTDTFHRHDRFTIDRTDGFSRLSHILHIITCVLAEIDVIRMIRTLHIQGGRPVLTTGILPALITVVPCPSSRKEYAIAIDLTGILTAGDSVGLRPGVGAILLQFLPFGECGHSPIATQFHMRGIILRFKRCLSVKESIIPIVGVCTILRHGVPFSHVIFVGRYIITVLGLSLSPSIIVAIFFGNRST